MFVGVREDKGLHLLLVLEVWQSEVTAVNIKNTINVIVHLLMVTEPVWKAVPRHRVNGEVRDLNLKLSENSIDNTKMAICIVEAPVAPILLGARDGV